MTLSLTSLSLMLSTMFLTMNHPLSMGVILLMQTITIAMTLGYMSNTFWFSYLLIMIMVSGMLILFIYMASIASNEKFKSTLKMPVIMMMMLPFILLLTEDHMETKKMWSSVMKSSMKTDQITGLIKLFNMHNMMITIMLVMYLLLMMIIISYIVNTKEGPLRLKN